MKPDDRDPVAERLMDGLKPPLPPPELRSKALAAAREQLTAEAVPDVWSRIWNSRGIRLAWAASVMVLLVGHILATLSPAKASTSVDPSLVAEHRVDEDYVDLLRPIRISDTVQPMVGLIAGASSPSVLDLEENPS